MHIFKYALRRFNDTPRYGVDWILDKMILHVNHIWRWRITFELAGGEGHLATCIHNAAQNA